MTTIALASLSRGNSYLQSAARFVADIAGGIREGHQIANRYEELSRLSDAALKARGLTRETIALAAVNGRGR